MFVDNLQVFVCNCDFVTTLWVRCWPDLFAPVTSVVAVTRISSQTYVLL